MLPSRGISGLRQTSGLRLPLAAQRQASKPWQSSSRQFSQIQRLGKSPQQWSSSSAALRGQACTIPRLTQLSRNPIRLGGAASGASRSLSLWPFGSSQQTGNSKAAESATSTTAPSLWDSPAASTPTPASPQPVQHATTAPAPAPAPESISSSSISDAATPSAPSLNPESLADLENSAIFDYNSILDIPEQIGYLKHLGLDFGWGPTAMCEWLLEHVYIASGLPWWAAITLVAVGVRAAWFYPTVLSQRSAAQLAMLQKDPAFIKASDEAKKLMWDKDADNMAKMKAQAKVQGLTKRAGVSYMRTLLPPLAMAPFSYGMFRLLRSMSALPVPSLEAGGFGWITDLTVYDPTYILPVASALLSAYTIRLHQKTNLNPTPQNESMNKFMLYGLTPLMFFVTMWFPAAVQYFFFVFAATTVAQSAALANPTVRRLAQLPPLAIRHKTPLNPAGIEYQPPSRGGLGGLMDGASKNLENIQKGFEDYTGGPAKAALKKAQDYEKKRAQEEKEKALNRRLENQRNRMSRRN